ncbi:MFS-type transporter EF102 [Pseudolycoriella hygida]|uniref:MFS-type transporter EF102 n=1 Tax=Pseudolycoriella hygida TaxID=35572 RepID=A0A9Q0NB44_9DIPT|nr:MFS-type transporter EF102 [Pseudolycoriella hygida]
MSSVSGYVFEKWGIKKALILGGVINLVGTGMRYFASFIDSSVDSFQPRLVVVLLGQFIAASAQPFFLNAPPKFAAVWFSESSRTIATTIGSVSNPFAAAVAMIVIPALCEQSSDMPFTLMICAIVAAVALVPAIFMPALPPTPPSASAAMSLADAADEPFWTAITKISKNLHFWILFIVFSIYVAFFNAFSSLINQIVIPYGYTDDEAGIFGALLIVSGIIGAGISGAVVDKTKKYRLVIRTCSPLLGLAYVGFIFVVRKDFIVGIGAVCCVIGLLSFGLLPVTLELGIECTFPVASSASTSLLWMGGQTFAVLFLVVGDMLRDESPNADPPENMKTALICMGFLACATSILCYLYNSPNYRLEAEQKQRDEKVEFARNHFRNIQCH